MQTVEITDAGLAVLRAFAAVEARHEVGTVQAAANESRVTFMNTFTLVNDLFNAGYLRHDLSLTEAGKKAVK